MKPVAVASLVLAGAALASKLVNVAADASAMSGGESADGAAVLDSVDLWGTVGAMYEGDQVGSVMQSNNVRAFLALIAYAEGTDRAADPYRVCYGYRHTVRNLSDHPAVTGEWRGESLASLGPSYAGKVSTAAGRYQIIRASWLEGKRALKLSDFGPAAQDAWAVWKIRQRGGLQAVIDGRVGDAIAACAKEWASLPGAGYAGQRERKLGELLAVFDGAGGVLA